MLHFKRKAFRLHFNPLLKRGEEGNAAGGNGEGNGNGEDGEGNGEGEAEVVVVVADNTVSSSSSSLDHLPPVTLPCSPTAPTPSFTTAKTIAKTIAKTSAKTSANKSLLKRGVSPHHNHNHYNHNHHPPASYGVGGIVCQRCSARFSTRHTLAAHLVSRVCFRGGGRKPGSGKLSKANSRILYQHPHRPTLSIVPGVNRGYRCLFCPHSSKEKWHLHSHLASHWLTKCPFESCPEVAEGLDRKTKITHIRVCHGAYAERMGRDDQDSDEEDDNGEEDYEYNSNGMIEAAYDNGAAAAAAAEEHVNNHLMDETSLDNNGEAAAAMLIRMPVIAEAEGEDTASSSSSSLQQQQQLAITTTITLPEQRRRPTNSKYTYQQPTTQPPKRTSSRNQEKRISYSNGGETESEDEGTLAWKRSRGSGGLQNRKSSSSSLENISLLHHHQQPSSSASASSTSVSLTLNLEHNTITKTVNHSSDHLMVNNSDGGSFYHTAATTGEFDGDHHEYYEDYEEYGDNVEDDGDYYRSKRGSNSSAGRGGGRGGGRRAAKQQRTSASLSSSCASLVSTKRKHPVIVLRNGPGSTSTTNSYRKKSLAISAAAAATLESFDPNSLDIVTRDWTPKEIKAMRRIVCFSTLSTDRRDADSHTNVLDTVTVEYKVWSAEDDSTTTSNLGHKMRAPNTPQSLGHDLMMPSVDQLNEHLGNSSAAPAAATPGTLIPSLVDSAIAAVSGATSTTVNATDISPDSVNISAAAVTSAGNGSTEIIPPPATATTSSAPETVTTTSTADSASNLPLPIPTFTPILHSQAYTEPLSSPQCRISCIYDAHTRDYYVTSVDLFLLIESITYPRQMPDYEKKLHRRIWEKFSPVKISRGEGGIGTAAGFFKQVMSYVDPCPRNVEKHLKVFRWSLLADMLQNSLAKINFLVQPRLQFILAGSTTGANASFSSSTIAESTSTTAAPTAVVAAVSNIVVNNSEAVLDVAKVNAFEFVSVAKAQGGGGAETSLKPPLAPSATSGSSSNTPMMPLDASQSASSSSSSLVLPAMKSARSSRASASSSHGNIPDNNFNISTAPPGAVDHFKSDDEVEVYIPQPTKSRRRSGNAAAASSGAGNTSISQHPMDISLDEAAAGNNGRRLLMRIPALGSSSSSASSSVIKLNIPVGSRPTTVTAEPAVRPRKKLIESAHQHSIYTLPELPDSAVVNESLQLDNALNAESHIRSAAVAFLANAAAATAATSGGSSTAAVVGAKRRRSSNGPAAVGGSAAKKTYLEDEFDPIYAEPEEDHDDGDEFRVQQATRRRRSGPPSSASSSSLSLPLAAAAGSVSSAPLAGGSNAVMAGKVPVVPNSTSNISSKKDDSDKWMAPTTEPTPGAVTTMLMYGWTDAEKAAKRRIVGFAMATDRSAVPVQVSFRAIIPDPAARASSSTQKKNANASAFSTDECRISIIYDQESDAYFVTSVDLFLLTEYISGIAIQRVDKIRHRRIWEKFFPRLMSRANAPDLFVQVMSYFNPCPRLIERDTNLFRWEFIEDVLSSSLVRMNKEHVVFTTRDSFAPPPGISTSLVLAIASDTAASFALAALGAAPGSAAKKAAGPRKTGAGSSSASKRQRVGGVGSVLAASPSSRRDNIVNNHRNIDGDYDDDNDNDNDEHNVNDPSSVGHKLEVDTASEDWAMNSTLLPLKRKREAAIPATLPPSSVYKIVLPPAPTVGTEASTSTAAAATSSSSSMVPGVAVAAEPSTLMVHLNAAAAVASAVAATTTITNSGAAALAAAPLAQDDTLSSASVVSSTAAKEDAAMALAFLINAPLSSVPETVAITGKSLMAAVELGLSSLAPRPIISDSAAAGAGAETILQVSPSSAVKSVVQADQSVAIIDEDVAAEMMQVDVAVVAAPPLAPAAEPVSADKRSVVAEDQYQPTDGISGYSDGELSEHGSLESSPDNSIRIGRLEDWAAAKTEQQSPSRSTKYEVEASSSSLVPLPMVEAKTDIGESGGNGGGSGSSDKDLLSKVLKYDQNLLAKVLQQLEAQGQTDVKK